MQHADVDNWNCTRCKGSLDGFEIHRSIFLFDWDLTAYVGYWPRFNALFVVFRGTDSKSISNWVSNLDAHRRAYTFPGVPAEKMPKTRGVTSRFPLQSRKAYGGQKPNMQQKKSGGVTFYTCSILLRPLCVPLGCTPSIFA